jgi:hypothetical protein
MKELSESRRRFVTASLTTAAVLMAPLRHRWIGHFNTGQRLTGVRFSGLYAAHQKLAD